MGGVLEKAEVRNLVASESENDSLGPVDLSDGGGLTSASAIHRLSGSTASEKYLASSSSSSSTTTTPEDPHGHRACTTRGRPRVVI